MSVSELVISALGAALDGESVAFFEASHSDARAMFKAAESVAPEGCEIRRTNGNESIRTRAGGAIHFLSVRAQGGRGIALDRAYVPAALASEDLVAMSIEVSLSTSKHPRFIGYF